MIRVKNVQILNESTISEGTKWAAFQVNVVCPNCKDKRGHAGLFPKTLANGSQHEMDYGSLGACVKCDETFVVTSLIDKSFKASTSKQISTKKNHWDCDFTSLNTNRLDKTLFQLYAHLYTHVPNFQSKTIQALKSRGYDQDLVAYLVNRGFGWLEPVKQELKLSTGSTAAAMFQVTNDAPDEFTAVYRQFTNLTGLLIPIYRFDHKTGYTVRNEQYGQQDKKRSKYVGLKTVNIGNNKFKDNSSKYLPPATFIETDLSQAPQVPYMTDLPGAVYVTEGEMKAEVLHYVLKEAVVGVRGVADFNNEEVKAFLLNHRDRDIVVCPDSDFTTKPGVASAVYSLVSWLDSVDMKVSILTWRHPEVAQKEIKGIDDALLLDKKRGGVLFTRLTAQQFLTLMPTEAKKKVMQTLVKPGMVFPESAIDSMRFIEKDLTSFYIQPDQWYSRSSGPEVYEDLIPKHKLIVDISPTGTGKSHKAGLFDIKRAQNLYMTDRLAGFTNKDKKGGFTAQLGLGFGEKDVAEEQFVKVVEENKPKRCKFIELSPYNNSVSTLKTEKWSVTSGRNSNGWTFDPVLKKFRYAKPGEPIIIQSNCPQADGINVLRNNRQVLNVNKEICVKCPFRSGCAYFTDKAKSKKQVYQRMSMSAFSPEKGDVVFIDDWGSHTHFTEFSISYEDISKFYMLLRYNKRWTKQADDVICFMERVLNYTKLGKTGRDVYDIMLESGDFDLFPIGQWLKLPEPDAVSTKKISVDCDGLYFGDDDDLVSLSGIKRFFFLFLQVFSGESFGDIYFKPGTSKNPLEDCWIIKGIDPKYKDMLEKVSNIIIYDATADVAALEKIFGVKPYIVSAHANPKANVTTKVVKGFKNTHKKALKSARGVQDVLTKFDYIANFIHKNPDKKVGILTFKELVENPLVREKFGPSITMGYWWNDDRASNIFYEAGCDVIFTVGVPTPNIASVAAESEVSDIGTSILVARPYGPVNSEGSQDFIICKDIADPVVRHNMWYKKSSSFIQALGRLRSVQQPDKHFEFIVMDDIPLPFPVDELVYISEEDKLEVAVADVGAKEKSLKIEYLQHLRDLFSGAIAQGYLGLSEDARVYLASQGYDMNHVARYAPDLKRYFSFQDMVDLLERRIEQISAEGSTLLPPLLQTARVQFIKDPEFSSDSLYLITDSSMITPLNTRKLAIAT